MRKILFLFSLLGALAAEIPPFALMTIPKSGSHLAIKTLRLLTGSDPVWHTQFPSLFYIPPEEGFLYTHLCLSPGLEQNYRDLPKLKKILMIRDLRDVAVSIVSQINKAPWPGMTGAQRAAFKAMPFDEQLLYAIEFEYDLHEVAECAPNSLQVSLIRVTEQAEKFSVMDDTFVCRYENLVGPMGGGSVEAQKEEIERLASFLDIEASDEWIAQIAAQVYGNAHNPFGKQGLQNFASTFSRGQIGSWKQAFQEKHIAAFKKKLGKNLVALGYERDDQW